MCGNSQSNPRKSQFLHLILLENKTLPTVRFSCFLDQFISTFSNRNYSVKFQDLKLSTKKQVANYFAKYNTQNFCVFARNGSNFLQGQIVVVALWSKCSFCVFGLDCLSLFSINTLCLGSRFFAFSSFMSQVACHWKVWLRALYYQNMSI